MNNDWTGNYKSIFRNLGASNHTDEQREINDYYATDPIAAEHLINIENLDASTRIWECSCGEGHLSKVFIKHGFDVLSSDLINRGYGYNGIDFLKCDKPFNGNIITNPPYKYATEFVYKALDLVTEGNKVCMFLKTQFLEGKARKKLFETFPPKTIHVSSSRIMCAKNGDFQKMKDGGGSAVSYSWFVWEKGYTDNTIIKWFN